MKALSISNLKKEYAGGLQALKGIDLEVEEGDFFALLGPNGAGKSTTIGVISSLVTKTSGQVKILDIDIDENHSIAKKKLGVVGQEVNFNQFEKVGDIVLNQAEKVVPQDRMDLDLPGYAWDLLPFKNNPLDLYVDTDFIVPGDINSAI